MKLIDRAKTKFDTHFKSLEKRYGRRQAKIIMTAAVIGLPLPIIGGSVIVAMPFWLAAEYLRRRKLKRA